MRTRLLLFALSFIVTTADNRAQQSPDPAFTLKQIGPSVWAAINNPVPESIRRQQRRVRPR